MTPSQPRSPTSGAQSSLKVAHVWDVISQIPINSRAGLHFSAKLSPLNRRRRISVEVHKIPPSKDADDFKQIKALPEKCDSVCMDFDACFIRVLEPPRTIDAYVDPLARRIKIDAKKAEKGIKNLLSRKLKNKSVHIDDEEKENDESHTDGEEDDDITVAADAFREADSEQREIEAFQGWYPKYKFPIQMTHIVLHNKRKVEVKVEHRGHTLQREFIFESESAATDFCDIIEKNKKLQEAYSKTRLDAALAGITLQKDEQLTFLFDICSASDLPRCDLLRKCDPYVTVRFNGKKIHRTSEISNNCDPIWTLKTKSLFIWKVDAIDLFSSDEGLIFEVKDLDTVGANQSLGAFSVSAQVLYRWDGERKTFALKPLPGHNDFGKGRVALRVKRATAYDVAFLENYDQNIKKTKEYHYFTNLKGGASTFKSLTTVYKKKEKQDTGISTIKYLARPGPDPRRKEETTWLTKEKIDEESMKESFNWIDIGSGRLGKIYVEVIGCNNLPNKDRGASLGNKADAFVSLVYEDCFARTDVIADCPSPRWFPWSERAFVFNMMHTSSQLFLAVFDCDTNALGDHDYIGRVSVDVSSFQSNTIYLLHYNLHYSAKCKRENVNQNVDHTSSIILRLRMELEDERTLLLSLFEYPSKVYINTDNKKDFHVIRKTIIGNRDLRQYGILNINAYWEELLDYLIVYYFLEDATLSLFLWKSTSVISIPIPHYRLYKVKWFNVSLPLHSTMAFICATSLVENLQLLPSFIFGSIGWLLFAIVEKRSRDPNPWKRSKSLHHLFFSLLLGKYPSGSQTINSDENIEEIEASEVSWRNRIKDAEEKAQKRALEYAKHQEEYYKELQRIGDDDITTKVDGFSIDPIKQYLLPYQEYLGIICNILRVIKNVIIWEEPYISFWITIGSFILSIIFYFVPWSFLVKWTLRIIVWTVLGPWMKLADMFYFSKIKPETEKQKKDREDREKSDRKKWLENQKMEALIIRERAVKLKDFKQFMFGNYVSHVNILKRDRYIDIPLPSSTAAPYSPKSLSLGSLAMEEAGYHHHRVYGQHLVGDLIPKLMEGSPSTEAPVGMPTKNFERLEKGSPGILYTGYDSYAAAVFNVGSIVVAAGAITYFGVPILAYLIETMFPTAN